MWKWVKNGKQGLLDRESIELATGLKSSNCRR